MTQSNTTWTDICDINDVPQNTGVCADFNGHQVAVFHIKNSANESLVKAVDNFDPYGKANVLSRGLISELDNEFYIASPLLKQLFNLDTGICAGDETVALKTFSVRLNDTTIQLGQ